MLGPVTWHPRFSNCQHFATFVAEGHWHSDAALWTPWLGFALGLTSMAALSFFPVSVGRAALHFAQFHFHRAHSFAYALAHPAPDPHRLAVKLQRQEQGLRDVSSFLQRAFLDDDHDQDELAHFASRA
jgi:hypothetical protein